MHMETTRIGRYRIVRKLGAGAFGSVYLALMEGEGNFSRHVAVKRLHREVTQDEEVVQLLIREARIGGLMNHDNVVPAMDLLRVHDEYFLISDYVDGIDLRELVYRVRLRGERLPPAFVAEVAQQIASGLVYIHNLRDHSGAALGLVHRDLKPSNVLLHRSGRVKISDFGATISRSLALPSEQDTVMGTPTFMAPEQARGEPASQASDLYSLGVVLLQALTMELPQTLHREPGQASSYTPAAPDELLATIPHESAAFVPLLADLLQVDPAHRPGSAAEVAGDLMGLCRIHTLRDSMAAVVERWIGRREDAAITDEPADLPTCVSGEYSVIGGPVSSRVEESSGDRSQATVRRDYAGSAARILPSQPLPPHRGAAHERHPPEDAVNTEIAKPEPIPPPQDASAPGRDADDIDTVRFKNPSEQRRAVSRQVSSLEGDYVAFGQSGGYRDWLAVAFIGIPVVALGIWGAMGWLKHDSPEGLMVHEDEATSAAEEETAEDESEEEDAEDEHESVQPPHGH